MITWPHTKGYLAFVATSNNQTKSGLTGIPSANEYKTVDWLVPVLERIIPTGIGYLKVLGSYRQAILERFRPRDTDLRLWAEAQRQSIIAKNHLPPGLVRLPDCSKITVPPGLHPYCVATDASVINGRAAWAFVTGGGWYQTGTIASSSSQEAEWMGVLAAAKFFGTNCKVSIVTDNRSVSELARQITAGRNKQPRWLTAASFRSGCDIIRARNIRIAWAPRNTHPLQSRADKLCGHVSDNFAPIKQLATTRRSCI